MHLHVCPVHDPQVFTRKRVEGYIRLGKARVEQLRGEHCLAAVIQARDRHRHQLSLSEVKLGRLQPGQGSRLAALGSRGQLHTQALGVFINRTAVI
jgi:hypothetical protein